MFVPNGILDIIIHYLNPHEIYLEELNKETEYLRASLSVIQVKDLQYRREVIIKTEDDFWGIWYSCFSSRGKLRCINVLKERKKKRDIEYGIINGDSLFDNSCYMLY